MSINPVQRPPFESAQNPALNQTSFHRAQFPDVLITSSTSFCPSWINDIVNNISTFFEKIKEWIGGFFGRRPGATTFEQHVLSPVTDHQIRHPNKLYAYHQIVQGRYMGLDRVIAQKFGLGNPQAFEALPLFSLNNPTVLRVNRPFLYEESTAHTMHWTANFADSQLFGFCEGPLLAQDELQVLEHPGLAHIKNSLPDELRTLGLYEVALFQNASRLGSLDTSTPLPNGQTLYGNYFARASTAEIQSRLTRFAEPTRSDIFAMAAPRIPSSWNGLPYRRNELAVLFFTAFNAFRSIKQVSEGKRVVVHTGNWGAGAFGNDAKTVHLLQMAAARAAKIDEIRMHPMSAANAFESATQLLQQIGTQHPAMNAGQFLDHLTANAAAYDLKYRQGNGS